MSDPGRCRTPTAEPAPTPTPASRPAPTPPPAASTCRRHARGEAGQSAVEFALVMPVVALVAVGLVQIGLAVRNQLAVELTAREAAREAAVALDTAGAARRAASRVTSLPVEVTTASDGSTVRVTVTYEDAVAIPLLGALMGPIRHRAVAVMALEPP